MTPPLRRIVRLTTVELRPGITIPAELLECGVSPEDIYRQVYGNEPVGRVRLIGEVAQTADFALQAVGLYEQRIHVLGEMNKTIACSIEKAKAELGYAPRFSLRNGMAASIRWCLENGQPL